jgi:hypothetical protein
MLIDIRGVIERENSRNIQKDTQPLHRQFREVSRHFYLPLVWKFNRVIRHLSRIHTFDQLKITRARAKVSKKNGPYLFLFI